jgi:hypothetical protein
VVGSDARTPKDGDIVIEYHPHSEQATRILGPEEFKEFSSRRSTNPLGPLDDQPWSPFSSREDFDFAAAVHDAKLNRNQIDKFIKLIQRCQEAPGSFTFNGYNDLKKTSDRASKLLTEVSTS